ncbi:MAG: DNA (cytosine-5-)-methyltransferase [Phascolarctobacterium sp.]|nr:DNA (cytosine-5-)-methyltransferase [Phascolarctobacterium sp.]
MEQTVCELFAGVGGFRLGLEKASSDWKTVWFSQWEPGKTKQWAHECYVAHWGDVDENTGVDIALVDKKDIPKHNLLVGGFPCQDYSVARPLPGAEGISGKKGVLWWQIRDTLQAHNAPFVLLENVDRLLKSPANQRGRDFGVMLACLASLNYSAEWRVVNAAEYGAAQRRRRTFIFAYKNNTKWGIYQGKNTVQEIFDSEGFFAKTFMINPVGDIDSCIIDYRNIHSVSEEFKFEFANAGYMHNGVVYTTKVVPVEENPVTLREVLEKDVDEKYYLGENLDKWQYLKGSKKILRTAKNGHQYTFSEGAIAFPDTLDTPSRTMLTSESSLNRSTHVIEDPQTKNLRLLTPVEAERLQGFEDDWTNTGMPEKFRYFCMGNALVVPMITRMGKTLDKIFKDE